jgi:peptidyl-prolyl cis-trans isomerase A (cyclophilin A)
MKLVLSLGLAALLVCMSPAHAQKVRLTTSVGDILVELDAEKAPKSVDNFLNYVKAGHYDGVIFHRVIGNFMIQTGGYRPDLSEKPTRAPIPLEVGKGLSNVRGSIAMARTNDPNSATSQFFINVNDNLRLDSAGGGYAVFGKVVDGMEVVDQIRAVPTRSAGIHGNLPEKPITIQKASVEK